MHNPLQKTHRRGTPLFLLLSTLVALMITSSPLTAPTVAEWYHYQNISSAEYTKNRGSWEIIELPKEFRINAIHAALLPTGKVLLVAGTGNNRDNFNQYNDQGVISVLKTAIFNPKTNGVKLIETPSDLFCGGHTFLQSGQLLVAGGTSGYELLETDVKKPAGQMVIHNENPDSSPRQFKKGTRFTSPRGLVYVSTQDVWVQPATKIDHGNGNVMIHHSSTKVFVEASGEGQNYITNSNEQFKISGLTGSDFQNIYGQGGPMTMDKQDFRGDNKAYEFDPFQEKYVKVGNMNESRWYPSLPITNNGQVLAVSGLDNAGIITTTTEWYNPETKNWTWGPNRQFPTYPALFRTNNPDILFFSGSNAGYGPVDNGRQPGFWNTITNDFQPVKGLRYPDIVETSGSVYLPPTKDSNDGSQSSRIMIAGGGGVGESNAVTARTDIIDTAGVKPQYTPGPNMPEALRYINLTVTPWDEVFANGGSRDYRAKGNSYSHKTFSFNPTSNSFTPMADELVSRSYHSGSLLLPDGRILVFGNDPLFSDKANTTIGIFEQRIEVFTPPQLYKGARPLLFGKQNQKLHRGQQITFSTDNANTIKTARLIPPSSATHVTNIEQRSIAAVVKKVDNTHISIKFPNDTNTLPNGWYMLFVTNTEGTPNEAIMVQVEG